MSGENSEIFPKLRPELQIGAFRYAPEGPTLLNETGDIIHLRRQSADVLACLAKQPGQVVSKSDLIETVWPNTFVTDDSLGQCISDIRRVLGDHDHQIIQTFPKKGYMLTAQNAGPSPVSHPSTLNGQTAPRPGLIWPWSMVAALIITSFVIWQTMWPMGSSDQRIPLTLPDDPSIIVLPFDNQSDIDTIDYLAAGFSTSIRTQLAKFPQIFVIAGSTSLTFKNSPGTARGIGRELGVRYVLDGTLRKVGEDFVITTELIEAESEHTVWAQQYDFTSDDALPVQTRLIEEIVSTLNVVIQDEELNAMRLRAAENPRAYDLFIRAEAETQKVTPEGRTKAIELLNRAIVIDPDYLAAHFELSGRYLSLWRFGGTEDPDATLQLARHHAQRARDISPHDYRGHFRMGMLYLFADHNHTLAHASFERAISDNPNDADVLYNMGFLRHLMGEPAEAIEWNNRAKRLNPRYPAWYNFNAALSHMFLNELAQAETLARLGIAAYPKSLAPRRILIATLVEANRMEEARKEVADYLAIRPDFRLSTFRNTPFQHQRDQDRYFNALIAAGLPY